MRCSLLLLLFYVFCINFFLLLLFCECPWTHKILHIREFILFTSFCYTLFAAFRFNVSLTILASSLEFRIRNSFYNLSAVCSSLFYCAIELVYRRLNQKSKLVLPTGRFLLFLLYLFFHLFLFRNINTAAVSQSVCVLNKAA